MKTYRDLIYMVLDELKINSDDSVWETDHIAFLLNKYRAFLLKQRYKDLKKDIPLPTYQQLLVTMEGVTNDSDLSIATSTQTIPNIINFNGLELEASVSPVINDKVNYFTYDFNFITIDRFKYVGINKWINKCIYCAIDYSNKLLLKSNSSITLPETVMINAILEDPRDIVNFMNPEEIPDDTIDLPFPIEEAFIAPLLEMTIKEFGTANYLPDESKNNAADDFSTQSGK